MFSIYIYIYIYILYLYRYTYIYMYIYIYITVYNISEPKRFWAHGTMRSSLLTRRDIGPKCYLYKHDG